MLTLEAIAGTLARDEQRRQFRPGPDTRRQTAARRWLQSLRSSLSGTETR